MYPLKEAQELERQLFTCADTATSQGFDCFFFLCFHVPFVHGHVRSGYEVMPALH